MHFCNQGSGIISVSVGQMKKLAQEAGVICQLERWQVLELGLQSRVGFPVWGRCSEQRLARTF